MATTIAEVRDINTIVLPIDERGVSRETLHTLVRVARHLDCRVLGLFIEDPRLQQLASLPFTTEVSLASGEERRLHPERLRSRLGKLNEDTRKLLDRMAGEHKVELTYNTASGARLPTALQLAGDLNIFLPTRRRWSFLHARRIPRLCVMLGLPEADERALSVARTLLAAGMVGVVHVFLPGPFDVKRMHSIDRSGLGAHVLRLDALDKGGITELMRRSTYDLYVVPLSSVRDIPQAQLEAALDSSLGQVLVVN